MDEHRYVKKSVQHIFTNRQEGDLCMDAPVVSSWQDLVNLAQDRDTWRDRVRVLKCSPSRR